MTTQDTRDGRKVRVFPPPARNFNPLTATEKDMKRHGLPLRPDPRAQPGLARLWEQRADRYRGFEHLDPEIDRSEARESMAVPAGLAPAPIESCGYHLFSPAPITALFVTWTVPNLRFVSSPVGFNRFRTFIGLGFLDVHVEMRVTSAQTVTAQVTAVAVGTVNLPVGPGDVLSASMCLDTAPPGRASYFLANETRGQTVNFSVDTGFPPAVTIDAGVSRIFSPQEQSLAQFGIVYFDEISAFSTAGTVSLTSGTAITMTETNGTTLARPSRLSDFAFKAVHASV